MTVKEFNVLVYEYGIEGTKVIENLPEDMQIAINRAYTVLDRVIDKITTLQADAVIEQFYNKNWINYTYENKAV